MTAVLAAVCAALAAGCLAWRLIHPRRSPLARIAPYTQVARARLGVPVESVSRPAVATEAARRLLGPLIAGIAGRLAAILHLGDHGDLERRLRQAGVPMTSEVYRRRSLRWSIATPVACALLGVALGSTVLTVSFFVLGGVAGARRMPDQLRSITRRRQARIRSDLPTIAGLLSPRIINNKSLAVAIGSLVEYGSGPVVDDLSRALHLTAAGYGLGPSLELVASEAAEDSAARFYRFLAAATTGAIDLPRSLLEQASELRALRREEVERAAARRQMSMVVPNLVLMTPVMILFLLAPIPTLIFGT